jgi:NAD(P)H-hydrate epimerase
MKRPIWEASEQNTSSLRLIKLFYTRSGIPIPAVTREQMEEVDRIALEETGPNLYQMMENAGRNVCRLAIDILGEGWKNSNIVILAGTGGNGGGGICTARHLANHGADVKVCLTNSNKLKEVPAYQLHILKFTNAKVISLEELQNEKPDLIIDAIIGYNLLGEPKDEPLELIKWASRQLGIKISLDVPSGINSTTGETARYHIKPDITLTLALPKTGLLPELTDELYLADIGIPSEVYKKMNLKYHQPFDNNYYIKLLTERPK